MKVKLQSWYVILFYFKQVRLLLADPTSVSSTYGLQGQCKGLRPVYDDHGNLIGYSGSCDIDKWNGSLSSANSLHYIDPNLTSLHKLGKIKYKQPKDVNLFDWLSPHHDIIRNHPHYRDAHLNHSHCIRKTKSGLFDFLGSLFNYDSRRKAFNDFSDPYSNLGKGERCLNHQYYSNNALDIEKKYYDPYALHLGHKIHHVKSQLDNIEPENIESQKKNLRKLYSQLHRHLDCHCHHESPQSKLLNIHHHPIDEHSMSMIAHPIIGSNSNDNLQIHSSIPLDQNMDMEDERMALTRMSKFAAQHAYTMDHFNEESLAGNGALRMEMFHPVNPYIDSSHSGISHDPEWNRLKVEKVIVIKRIKVPLVTKVAVPVPVPVPYPISTSSNAMTSKNNQYLNNDNQDSQFQDSQPQYLGNNTYMIDTPESRSEQMNSVVRAISGAPCESTVQYYKNPLYYPKMYRFPNQSYNNSSPLDFRMPDQSGTIHMPN